MPAVLPLVTAGLNERHITDLREPFSLFFSTFRCSLQRRRLVTSQPASWKRASVDIGEGISLALRLVLDPLLRRDTAA